MGLPFDITGCHAGLASYRAILAEMETLYQNLDAKLAGINDSALCVACGKCCDFESFGHRLYLTTPERLFFAHKVERPLKPMTGGVCPYRSEGQCSVYPFRFAGCRIFQCKGSPETQSDLTEATLSRLKLLCSQYAIPYHYMDLKTALSRTIT